MQIKDISKEIEKEFEPEYVAADSEESDTESKFVQESIEESDVDIEVSIISYFYFFESNIFNMKLKELYIFKNEYICIYFFIISRINY